MIWSKLLSSVTLLFFRKIQAESSFQLCTPTKRVVPHMVAPALVSYEVLTHCLPDAASCDFASCPRLGACAGQVLGLFLRVNLGAGSGEDS